MGSSSGDVETVSLFTQELPRRAKRANMDRWFETLLKYPRVVFEKGQFSLKTGSLPIFLIGLALVAVLVFIAYRPSIKKAPTWLTGVLVPLRVVTIGLLLFSMMRPVLLVSSAIPQKNFVAILYDTSKSMTIRDGAGQKRRADEVAEMLSAAKWLPRIQDKFQVRFFQFSESAERVRAFEKYEPEGNVSFIERALRGAVDEIGSVPLAGVILITDGADNRSARLPELVRDFKARHIPVYPIGVGQEQIPRDIEIQKVTAPKSVLKDSVAVADVMVRNTGYPGKRVIVEVSEDRRVIQSRDITLSGDEQVSNHKISFTAATAGLHTYNVKIKPQTDEVIVENNEQDFLMRVEDAVQAGVLYFEGEPRWENKFLLRALEDDKSLRVASYLRTGKKTYRIQAQKGELQSGYPGDKKLLFDYKAVIFGCMEASFFNLDQLKATEEFVSRRGGGFLMLGCGKTFGEGGYLGTPMENVLPVLPATAHSGLAADTEVRAQITEYGKLHPITRLSINDDENLRLWSALPPVHINTGAVALKPGATSLLAAEVSGGGRQGQPLLALQRYGRGRALMIGANDIYRWRMEVPSQTKSFETFWKQLVRWMVSNAPDPIMVSLDRDSVHTGGNVTIRAEVNDSEFKRVNNAKVTARIMKSGGKSEEKTLDWIGSEDGVYQAVYQPKDEGIYTIAVRADAAGREKITTVGRADFRAGPTNLEYINPALNRDLLQRLADDTGGKYHTVKDAGLIPEELTYSTSNNASAVVEKELWDMPLLFLLFTLLLFAEWAVRKRYRLA